MNDRLTKLGHWFKKAHWLHALLSFFIFSFFGAVAGFLWWGYTAERIQGFNVEECEKQERAQEVDMEQGVLQSGFGCGLFGLASYGVFFLLLKNKRAKDT
jgi:hypothetical protein